MRVKAGNTQTGDNFVIEFPGATVTESAGKTTVAPAPSRPELLTAGQGLIGQNYDRQVASSTQIMIDGTVYFMLVGLRAGDVVSNISVVVTNIGITPTLSKLGLYTKAGVQLAASADLGAAWTTASGTITSAVSSYTVLADDVYYVAVVCKASTLPTLARVSTSAAFTSIAGTPRPVGTQAAQTDLPSPATIVAGTPFSFWVGIS